MEDFIQKSTKDYLTKLNSELRPSSEFSQQPLQILIHLLCCASELHNQLEIEKTKSDVSKQIYHPFLNGILSSMGKIIMDCITFEPKFSELENFSHSFSSVLKHTMKLFPDMALKRHKSSGKVLLHHAAFKVRPALAESALQTIISVAPSTAGIQDANGALPLHWATRNVELAVEALDLLIQAFPEGPMTVDNKGFLPLHWAVNQEDMNVEIIKKLIKLYPQAASKQTSSGNLPLHYCVAREKPSIAVIRALINANPESLKVKCEEGFLPLHRYVFRASIDVEILKLLLRYYPEAVQSVANNRQTPLHTALDHPDPIFEGLHLLFSEYMDASKIADNEGYFPLHLSLDRVAPDFKLSEKILAHYPDAAKMKTNDGMFPLHLLISGNANPSIEFAKHLCDVCPDAIFHEVRDAVPATDTVVSFHSESWSGEWVEKIWTPIQRAKERGLKEFVQLFQSYGELQLPTIEEVPKENSPTFKPKTLPQSIHKSNPLKVIDPENDSPILKTPVSAWKTSNSDQLFESSDGPEILDSTSPDVGRYRSHDRSQDEIQIKPFMRPPSNPAPVSLLQAAENNMKMSKAQYDLLKSKVSRRTTKSKEKLKSDISIGSDSISEVPESKTRLNQQISFNNLAEDNPVDYQANPNGDIESALSESLETNSKVRRKPPPRQYLKKAPSIKTNSVSPLDIV
jgi:ankyrin repeat protein